MGSKRFLNSTLSRATLLIARQPIEKHNDWYVYPSQKSLFKRLSSDAGVPCVPGYHGPNQDPEFLYQEAEKIGKFLLSKYIEVNLSVSHRLSRPY